MDLGTRPTSGFPPYEAPSDSSAHDTPRPAPVFYAIDSRRVTLRECWRGSPLQRGARRALKLLRIKLPSATDDPSVESLLPFEVDAGDVPGVIVQRCSILLNQLKALGFHSPIWHVIQDDVHQVKTYMATLVGDSGRVWARVHHRVWSVRTPPRTNLFCELVSEIGDGSFLWSLSVRPDLAAPRSCTVLRDVGATPSKLLARHLSELRLTGIEKVTLVDSPDALRSAVERHHAVVRDFHLARRVFVPLTADERANAAAFRSSVTTAQETGSRYPEILAEIDRLQRRKGSPMNGFLLLLASVALFVGAGVGDPAGQKFPKSFLAILVGVLFVHEIGHWIAMRAFGYRNLKMFFIPFFGAAVSGRHYNVPGWKKVIVSLMGPLPGIVLGVALGAAGVALHHELLIQISLVAVLLNGFNLLPILPLDGGWVVQAIFFSRHHLLELMFRVAAIGALIVLAAATKDKFLPYLGIAMAVALPTMYKLARITSALRKERLPAASADGQSVPPATAEAIVERLKAAFPKKLSNKVAAQHTLTIFENLNARPPGVLASLGFATLQFGAIAASAVAATLIFVGGRAAMTPKLDASTIAVVRTPGDSALAMPRNVLVATFPKPDRMPAAIGALQRLTLPAMGVERIGQTLLVSLPFEDVDGLRAAQTTLEGGDAKLFVATPEEPARLQLACTATSAAAGKAIEQELDPYLRGAGLALLPPWQPGAAWPAEEGARYARVRTSYLRASKALAGAYRAPELTAFVGRMIAASKARDTVLTARLDSERTEVLATLRRERIAALRDSVGMDTAVVAAFALIESEPDTATASARRSELLAPLLGQLPLVDGHPVPGSAGGRCPGS
jgi:Zn-dependent proteases